MRERDAGPGGTIPCIPIGRISRPLMFSACTFASNFFCSCGVTDVVVDMVLVAARSARCEVHHIAENPVRS